LARVRGLSTCCVRAWAGRAVLRHAAALARRYDGKEISTEEFRAAGSRIFFPPAGERRPNLEAFLFSTNGFYGTGIPSLKLAWALKGKAPNLKLVGPWRNPAWTRIHSLAPVEIELARPETVNEWVRAAPTGHFHRRLQQAPLKVTLPKKNRM